MGNAHTRLMRFVSALGLALLLALVAQTSSAHGQDTHNVTPPPVTYNENSNGRVGIPYNAACRNRCNRDYRRCLRRGGSKAACRRQYRRCLQRCPQ